MWQQFVERTKDTGVKLLSVAMDAQGPAKPLPYVQRAKTTFPTVVDVENELGKAFNFKAIPNGIFVDEQGVVRYTKFGGFEIRKPEDAQRAEEWAKGKADAELAVMSQAEAAKGMKHPEALEFYDRGLVLYRQGRVQEAVALWRKVIAIEPDNFIVRKQVWAVEHPEKFYDGAVDFAWQREQMAKGQ